MDCQCINCPSITQGPITVPPRPLPCNGQDISSSLTCEPVVDLGYTQVSLEIGSSDGYISKGTYVITINDGFTILNNGIQVPTGCPRPLSWSSDCYILGLNSQTIVSLGGCQSLHSGVGFSAQTLNCNGDSCTVDGRQKNSFAYSYIHNIGGSLIGTYRVFFDLTLQKVSASQCFGGGRYQLIFNAVIVTILYYDISFQLYVSMGETWSLLYESPYYLYPSDKLTLQKSAICSGLSSSDPSLIGLLNARRGDAIYQTFGKTVSGFPLSIDIEFS